MRLLSRLCRVRPPADERPAVALEQRKEEAILEGLPAGAGEEVAVVRIIVSAILLVLLAVLVAFNTQFTTSVSVFGVRFDGLPMIAVALVSFAFGIIYSLFLYVSGYLHRKSRQGLETKGKALAQRERDLAARESATSSAGASGSSLEARDPLPGGNERTDAPDGGQTPTAP